MAELVGALIIEAIIPSGIGLEASTLTVAGFTVSATTVGSAALLSASLAVALATAPKQQKLADGLLSIRQPNPVRQGLYGRDRVAGAYMLYEATFVGLSVDVLALVSGRICTVKTIYLNEDAPLRSGTTIIGAADGRYFGSPSLVAVEWRLGLDHETAYTFVVSQLPSLWSFNHRGDGIASLALYCNQTNTIDSQPKAYPNGLPNPSAECDGYPLWDPRDSSQDPDDPDSWCAYPVWDAGVTYNAGDRIILPMTSVGTAYSGATTYSRWNVVSYGGSDYYSRVNGNVGHLPTDTNYWIPFGAPYYSYGGGNIGNQPDLFPDVWCAVLSNPILQLIDFLTSPDHGMGLDRDTLIIPALDVIRQKANLCDALVADKNGDLGPRYTASGAFNFDEDPADIIAGIGASCDLWLAEDGDGALAIEIGVYSPPTFTIKSKDIVGLSVQYAQADEQTVNELTLTFTDPANTYKEVPGQAWRDEDDISSRGLLRTQPLALKWVQRHSQARRLAKRAMARLNVPHGTVTTRLTALEALGQRWVGLSYPFLPAMGSDSAPIVVEIGRASIDLMAGTITFDWLLVDPATIDAWNPVEEEGSGPGQVSGSVTTTDGE